MNTSLDDRPNPATPSTPPGGATRRRRILTLAAAASAAVVVAAILVATTGGDDDAEIAGEVAGPPLELSVGASDALASCMPFDIAFLADMSPAFAGTVTAVEGETVTMTVDRWYAGGDENTVVLTSSPGSVALIGGIDFQLGGAYLVTAAEGTVNACGYSGPATPELTAAFEEAFGR